VPHTYEELDQIESEFRDALMRLQRTHNLTRAETLDILSRVIYERLRVMAKYMLKEERGE
jgi:hypothetical protein